MVIVLVEIRASPNGGTREALEVVRPGGARGQLHLVHILEGSERHLTTEKPSPKKITAKQYSKRVQVELY